MVEQGTNEVESGVEVTEVEACHLAIHMAAAMECTNTIKLWAVEGILIHIHQNTVMMSSDLKNASLQLTR